MGKYLIFEKQKWHVHIEKPFYSDPRRALLVNTLEMYVQYIGGCSLHRGMFSTSGVFSTSVGYREYIGGSMSTSGHQGDS